MTKEEIQLFIKRLKVAGTTYQFCEYAGLSYWTINKIRDGKNVRFSTHNKFIKKAKAFNSKLDSQCPLT